MRTTNLLKYFAVFFAAFTLSSCGTSRMVKQEKMLYPKREFRGVWIQTIFQDDYRTQTSEGFRVLMTSRLDKLKSYGINAVFFQVRPEADAFYPSDLEPWSRWLTGRQGEAPDEPGFDPMAFLIDACHDRGMEFHAWLNPYRAGTANFSDFAESHVCHEHPEWFVQYNKQTLFDPGVPECRQFFCGVVKDIVSRYDVDGIHLDDYFYPYPVAGEDFPDTESFEKYGRVEGFALNKRDDWRRDNVNRLVQELKQTIASVKPWVRFGISPFGIYRNKSNSRKGSKTGGTQNYDDLYADILLWMKKDWIDYCVPQLYWEIGHKTADYTTLIKWWNKQNTNVPLYIGQDVDRTMKAGQLMTKMIEEREAKRTEGNVFWPANELLRNNTGVSDSLRRIYHRYPALIPAYTQMNKEKPDVVHNLHAETVEDGVKLQWVAPQDIEHPHWASYFVVYRFAKGEKCDTERASAIVALTREPFCLITPGNDSRTYIYEVTAVDRFHNESKPSMKIEIAF